MFVLLGSRRMFILGLIRDVCLIGFTSLSNQQTNLRRPGSANALLAEQGCDIIYNNQHSELKITNNFGSSVNGCIVTFNIF